MIFQRHQKSGRTSPAANIVNALLNVEKHFLPVPRKRKRLLALIHYDFARTAYPS